MYTKDARFDSELIVMKDNRDDSKEVRYSGHFWPAFEEAQASDSGGPSVSQGNEWRSVLRGSIGPLGLKTRALRPESHLVKEGSYLWFPLSSYSRS